MCNVAVEWTSPINRVVCTYPCNKYELGVKHALGYMSSSPSHKPLKQERGRQSENHQLTADQLAESRRVYRFDVCLECTVG